MPGLTVTVLALSLPTGPAYAPLVARAGAGASEPAAGGPPEFLGATAALVLTAAVIGYVSVRLKVVPIVGFLLAGVLIGPTQLGVVDSVDAVEFAAEVGVIFLLFTIGIEFSLERLAALRTWIAVGGGLQVGLCVAAVAGICLAAGVDWREAVFTGLLVSMSSTAIILKLLGDARDTGSTRGRLAVALSLFQDLAAVAIVLLLPLLGSEGSGSPGSSEAGQAAGGSPLLGLVTALGTAALLIGFVLVAARRLLPPVLELVARTCSPEVFLLTILALCFGTAYGASLAGVSVSLGAFLAGLLVSESRLSSQALGEILPLQILFSAVFFVSVGMLLDVRFVLANLPAVLLVCASVLVVKFLTAYVAAAVLRVGVGTSIATAALLAQVGEFSFVLESAGRAVGLSPGGLGDSGAQTFIAAAVVLLVLSPLVATAGSQTQRRLEARRRQRAQRAGLAGAGQAGAGQAGAGQAGDVRTGAGGSATGVGARGSGGGSDPGGDGSDAGGDGHGSEAARAQVLLSGWGPATRSLAAELCTRGVDLTVVTLNPDGASEATGEGHRVVLGDSTKLPVLQAAGIDRTRLLVVAEDDQDQTARVAAMVAGLPQYDVPVVARPLGGADVGALAQAGVDRVVDPEGASRRALLQTVLSALDGEAEDGSDDRPLVLLPGLSGGQRGGVVDMSRIVRYRPAEGEATCEDLDATVPVLPAAEGCIECLRTGQRWVHLRVCLSCGYVGCCDSSPGQHARRHHETEDHPVAASAERGEGWAHCFVHRVTAEGS